MGKSNFQGGGPFDPPSGQVTVETPDGVTKTFGGGEVKNNLMNAAWVSGGATHGGAYGMWPENDSEPGALAIGPPGRSDRFRIG